MTRTIWMLLAALALSVSASAQVDKKTRIEVPLFEGGAGRDFFGPGGPGGGRGGDAHPTLFDPTGTGAIDQFVTPERSERGFGSIIKLEVIGDKLKVAGKLGL